MSIENQQCAAGDEYLAMGEGQTIRQGQIGNVVVTNSGKHISICPMCNGKGYYEEVAKLEVGGGFKTLSTASDKKTCILPSIKRSRQTPSYKLEQIFKANDKKTLTRVSDSAMPASAPTRPNTRLPPVHITSSVGQQMHSSIGQVKHSPTNYNQVINFLPSPLKSEKHPADAARLAAIKLNRSEWETKKAGLEECLQLAYFNPEELEPYMSAVYRTISSLLNSFRPQVTLFLCQAAREFFAHMRSTCRPEFDELAFSLLSRTADNNRYIRLHANDALDKMITYIPTVHAIRPIVEKGPIHNNPLVRSATARLLTTIVASKTPNAILTHPNLRESCKRILETAAMLLADNNLDTRAAAKKLFQGFLNEEEFESIYYAEVDEKLRRRVDRLFVELKCKKLVPTKTKDSMDVGE